MPSPQEHKTQAFHNASLARELDGSPYSDWSITAYFYAAHHQVLKLLAKKKKPFPTTYDKARSYMKQIGLARKVRKKWAKLLDLSFNARYQCPDKNTISHDLEEARKIYHELMDLLR